MNITEVSRTIHVIDQHIKYKESQQLLTISDIHFDSVNCDRVLLKKHLDEAKERNAWIYINGDWFDLMQGRYDPRRSYKDIRPEYMGDDYLDLVINDSVKFLTPYVNNIIGIGLGNHCTSVLKHCGTNAIERLVTLLNAHNGSNIKSCGYSGWIVFRFYAGKGNTGLRKKILKYHHGSRGNAKRSKGILSVDIDAAKWPDANIIIKGDDHMKWYYPSMVRQRIDRKFNMFKDIQHHIRLGSYVDGLQDSFGGWAVEKDFQETKLGGWWIKFTLNHCIDRTANGIEIEVNEAI